jgi:hypothetical protein
MTINFLSVHWWTILNRVFISVLMSISVCAYVRIILWITGCRKNRWLFIAVVICGSWTTFFQSLPAVNIYSDALSAPVRWSNYFHCRRMTDSGISFHNQQHCQVQVFLSLYRSLYTISQNAEYCKLSYTGSRYDIQSFGSF